MKQVSFKNEMQQKLGQLVLCGTVSFHKISFYR